MSHSTTLLPMLRPSALDTFSRIAGDADGVNIRALGPLTSVFVRTKNSTYHINVLNGTTAIVQGGRFFPSARSAEVSGATMGGSLIKIGWIGVGFCLELLADGQRIITTRVRTVVVERSPGQSRPH